MRAGQAARGESMGFLESDDPGFDFSLYHFCDVCTPAADATSEAELLHHKMGIISISTSMLIKWLNDNRQIKYLEQ